MGAGAIRPVGRTGLLAALVATVFVLGPGLALGAGSQAPAPSGQRLSLEESYRIPIDELSALAAVAQGPSQIALLAAGDSGYRIARLVQPLPSGPAAIDTVELSALVGGRENKASQWEAIAVDGQGNPCFQAEVTAQVRCLDQGLHRPLAAFRLDLSTLRGLDSAWRADPNSRGEGMLLLQRGHVLLLKEKKPSLLVELGPPGAPSSGYSPDNLLKSGEAFLFPAPGGQLVALKVWEFADSLSKLARDASELAAGPDGRIYLLSDESAVLVRLEGRLKPDESKVSESAFWKLPKEIVKPEGLAIDQGLQPWIAIDSKHDEGPNLFRLSPIVAP